MRKFVTGALTAAVAASAGMVTFAMPAQADTCAFVCMYEDPNMGGSRYVNDAQTDLNVCHEIDGWDGDNEISSVSNPSGQYIMLQANDCDAADKGRTSVVLPFSTVDNLGDRGYDNEAESYYYFYP